MDVIFITLFIVLVVGIAGFYNKKLRRRYLSDKIYHWFVRSLPPMKQTEKDAIDAGDVGWERELFQGKPNWQNLLNMPIPTLTPEEKSFLDNQVETLCSMLNDWEITHELCDLPQDAWDYLRKEKFFGMIIPMQYGGLEFSHFAHSCVIVKIASRSVTGAVTTMVPNSLGPAELLLEYGTQKQRDYYLPRLATGEEIPCFALTGPEVGSDAASMPDSGVVCKEHFEGKETLGIRLSFDKRYITLAPIATVMGLAFKLHDPDHLIGNKTHIGITVCLIPMNHPGIESGKRHFPLNSAFMNGPIHAKNIFIPLDYIIGGVEKAGQGWRMLMECLSAGRGISLPAISTATGMMCFRTTGAYAAIRRQFNLPLASFEGVQEPLARINGYTYLLEATRIFTISALNQYKRPAIATAMAKYHMTEIARKIINDAMDIHGGKGIMMGPSNYLARGYEGIPISITVEGANILTRCLMIFGQGAIRCHPFLNQEMNLAANHENANDETLEAFDKVLVNHIHYFIGNLFRCLFLGITGGHLYWGPIKNNTKPYIKKLNWLSAGLALTADVSMLLLGGALKRKERLSGRLGDVLSYLYLSSAVIKYYHDSGSPNNDVDTIEWILQTCLYETQEAFYSFFRNLPNRFVGIILKWVVFPFGRVFDKPCDKLEKRLVRSMTAPNEIRERICGLCYIGSSESSPLGLTELAFAQLNECQGIIDKINQAVKAKEIKKDLPFSEKIIIAKKQQIISDEEASKVDAFEKIRQKLISVDAFEPSYPLGTKAHEKYENV